MPTSSSLVSDTLQTIAKAWLSAIRVARDYKKTVFDVQAQNAMKYYDNTYDIGDFMNVAASAYSAPPATIKFNKVAEVVQLFGPALYHDNPTRILTSMSLPEMPAADMAAAMLPPDIVMQAMQQAQAQGMDPAMAKMQIEQIALQQSQTQTLAYDSERMHMDAKNKLISILGGKYLNYTPYELDLRGNSHMAIDEAIVKGMGVMWTDVVTMPITGQRMVGTFWDNTDNYVHDPDWNMSDDRSCKWKARMCVAPVWQVERDYNLPPGKLTPNMESMSASLADDPVTAYKRQAGQTNNLVVYWKIWSKMGVGDRLPGLDPSLRTRFGGYGDYVYLVVADGVDYPLNLQPETIGSAGDQEIMKMIDWPIPFYGDNDWPCECLSFHRNFKSNYPLSHISFAIGEIQFMNWLVSMIATKLHTTSRDLLFLAKAVTDEVEAAFKRGGDLTTVKIALSGGQKLDDQAKYIQAPPMNTDIMNVVPMVMDMLDKRLGTNALLYGDSNGIFRSASEAEIKNTNSKSRIDAMAKEVNHMAANVAKKEFIAARTVLAPPDLMPIFGAQGTNLWGQFIAQADASQMFRQIQVRIEESSTRTPNRERLADNMRDAVQTLGPILAGHATATGDFTAMNALMADWGRSLDLDTKPYQIANMLPPMAPGMPPTPAGGGQPAAATLPADTQVGSNT